MVTFYPTLPRPTLQSVLIRANKDFTIDIFSKNLHGTDIALACPDGHCVEIEPWRKPTSNRYCLPIHGM